MIIGLVGRMASGKGEVVRILQNMGFSYIMLSDFVREEAVERGMLEERGNLIEIGNSMRESEGASTLAKRALKKIYAADIGGGANTGNIGAGSAVRKNWVIDGIRNPAEIDELRRGCRWGEKFFLIGIDARQDLLVERILSRKRADDTLSRDEIIKKLEQEWGRGEPKDGQQVGECMKKVDFVIKNEGTVDEFKQNFLSYFNNIKDVA